jgi:sulfur relay (sulfurtransferase) DsrC/TusE family protein
MTGNRCQFDVLSMILSRIEDPRIGCSDWALHESVYKLSAKKKFRGLLAGYLFEDHSYYHHSPELQADLDNLQLCGLIAPFYDGYEVSPSMRSVAEEMKGMFGEDEKALIESMAKELRKEMLKSVKEVR